MGYPSGPRHECVKSSFFQIAVSFVDDIENANETESIGIGISYENANDAIWMHVPQPIVVCRGRATSRPQQ